MRTRRISHGCYRLAGARPQGVKPSGGLKVVVAFLVIGLGIITAQMSACSRVQSFVEPKPAASTQSANTATKHLDPQQPLQSPQAVMRTVTVKFDYDFSMFPACSAKVTQKCVQQFNVYEVSAKPPIFLFSIPLPRKTKGMVKGITGSAPQKRSLFTGPHRFGVTAKGPGLNYESDPFQSMTFAQVLPDSVAAPAPSKSSPKK
jgi:hypothetical protein